LPRGADLEQRGSVARHRGPATTVSRWLSGAAKVPPPIAAVIRDLAAFHLSHPFIEPLP